MVPAPVQRPLWVPVSSGKEGFLLGVGMKRKEKKHSWTEPLEGGPGVHRLSVPRFLVLGTWLVRRECLWCEQNQEESRGLRTPVPLLPAAPQSCLGEGPAARGVSNASRLPRRDVRHGVVMWAQWSQGLAAVAAEQVLSIW